MRFIRSNFIHQVCVHKQLVFVQVSEQQNEEIRLQEKRKLKLTIL